MNSQNYRQLGIKHFRQKQFELAKVYFCLAYEKRKNKRLLILIELADLALENEPEAILMFEFYLLDYKHKHIDKEIEQNLNAINSKKHSEHTFYNSLNYVDFLKSESAVGFDKSFENIIHNVKLTIENKDDLLDFLEKLLLNGYKEIALDYIELIMPHFWANERFINISKKLKNEDKI